MSSITRLSAVLAQIVALSWSLSPMMLSAQEAFPEEIELPSSPVRVNLTNAVVRIVADDAVDPLLRWRRARSDDPGSAKLSVTQDGGSIVIERPLPAEGEATARLVVEIFMPTDRSVAVIGARMDLSIALTLTEEPEQPTIDAPPADAAPPAESAPPLTTDLRLVDSAATISGLGTVTGAFEGSVVEFHKTTGAYELSSVDGELRIVSHTGIATVTALNSDVTADGTSGRLMFQLTGGSANLRSTRGKFKIEAADSQIQVMGALGSGSIAVTDSNADLRNTRLKNLNLKGVSSYVTMASCSSTTTVDFTGGSLTADDGTGNITGTARDGARIDFTEHRGDVKISLQEDSTADLTRIGGKVTVNANHAELNLDGAKGLALTTIQSWARVSAISKLESFKVVRSEIELDLSENRDRNLTIAVQAESRVRVRLTTPCRVQAKGLSASMASQIDVTGCELQLGKGGRWSTRRARGIDGRPPVTLTAQVAESATLTVEGRP